MLEVAFLKVLMDRALAKWPELYTVEFKARWNFDVEISVGHGQIKIQTFSLEDFIKELQ